MDKTYDMYKRFTESDWKLFRKKIIIWQGNYINKINKEYIAVLSQDKSPAEKFWELEKRIEKDKRHPGVIIEIKRSNMLLNIFNLLDKEVIGIEDLDDFSDIFKEAFAVNAKAFSSDYAQEGDNVKIISKN